MNLALEAWCGRCGAMGEALLGAVASNGWQREHTETKESHVAGASTAHASPKSETSRNAA
jgi:hypothetical protein